MIKDSRSKKYRKHFFISLFLFFISFTHAQDTVLYSSSGESFIISYIKNAGVREQNSNEILETIAEDAIKPRANTHFTLKFQLQIKTAGQIPGVITLLAVIRDPSLTGDINFRKFGISDVLLPDRIDLDLKIWKKSDTASFMGSKVTHLRLSGDNSPVLISEIHGFGKNWDTLEVKALFFYYDEEALARFREKVHLINDYYASSFVADSLLFMADHMDLRFTGLNPAYFIQLREIHKMIDLMESKNFSEKLNLTVKDRLGLNPKISRLVKFLRSADMTFRENLENPGILFRNPAIDSVVNRFLSGILRYIRWSLILTTYNGRIYQEYLDDYFIKPDFGRDDSEILRKLIIKLFPGKDPDSLFRSLSETLKSAYEIQAESLILQAQYTEAAKILDNESQFCRVNPYLEGKTPDRKLQAKALQGIYSSYVSVAEMCTDNGKYDLAQNYLAKAQFYRHTGSDTTGSDSLFNKVFYKIFNTWIAGCDSLAAQGEFEQAVKCYHQVETRLDTSIQEGHIEIAARINRVTTSQKHDSAGRLEYRDDMIKHLLDGESMIWSGQYPAASRFVDSIGEQFRTNGFANDPLVVNAILKYRNKIREQICWDSKEAYEIFTLRAQHEIEKRKFLAAGILLDSALLIASSTPLCKINASDPTDTLRKYSAAIEYQKHIMEIRDYIRVDNYDQALKQNVMADGLYRENYLNRFGIEFFSLYDVINANGDLLFTGHAVVFYSNMDSLQEAFRYVKLLRSQGYPKRSAKDFLDILGKKMAKEDFRKYPTEDPASLVDGYTRYDGWFRSFKASYLNVSRKNKLMNRRSIDKQ